MTSSSPKLSKVHPELASKVITLLATMAALGHPMVVTDGFRTLEQQRALWRQGRSTPGKIVTHADGLTNRSNHQARSDGLGHAVDCCFVVNNKPSWDSHLPWIEYGKQAKLLGLKWGGDWSKPDLPHIED